jgi:hypothetical protein
MVVGCVASDAFSGKESGTHRVMYAALRSRMGDSLDPTLKLFAANLDEARRGGEVVAGFCVSDGVAYALLRKE